MQSDSNEDSENKVVPHACGSFDPATATTTIRVQDGWTYSVATGSEIPLFRYHTTQWVKNLPCQHTDRKTDRACDHCPRQAS